MNEHGHVDAACPKQMRFGPCGGVRNGGACEVDARPCPFVGSAVATPPARRAVPLPFVTSEPTLIVDVRAPRKWNGDARSLWRATAAALDGSVALLGEHVDNPSLLDDAGALAPEEVVAILARAGVATVVTITGRDRDIDGASRRIARYRDAGAAAIHCVTGDHPLAIGLERPAHFGAEAMTLIAAATDAGIAVTVGESPASPGARAERLRAKAMAGAAGCILNHAGAPDDLVAFADAVDRTDPLAAGHAPLALFAPVPLVTSRQSALTLNAFPGLRLPPRYLDAIIASPNPEQEGLRRATELAHALFASHRFAGVNLSGGGHRADPYDRLRITARYIDALRSAGPSAQRQWAQR